MSEVSTSKPCTMPSKPSAVESWRMLAPVQIRVEKVILSSGILESRLPIGSAFRLTTYLQSVAMEPLCNVRLAPTPGYASANCRSTKTTCRLLGFPRRVLTRTIRFDPPDAISFPITIAHVPLGAHISCRLTSMDALCTPSIEFVVPVFSPSGLLLQGRHLVPFRYRPRWRRSRSTSRSIQEIGGELPWHQGLNRDSDWSAPGRKTDEESTSSRSSSCSSANLISSLSSFSDCEGSESLVLGRSKHHRLRSNGTPRIFTHRIGAPRHLIRQAAGQCDIPDSGNTAATADVSPAWPKIRSWKAHSRRGLSFTGPNVLPSSKRFRIRYPSELSKIQSRRRYHNAAPGGGVIRGPNMASKATHFYKLLDLFDRGLIRPIGTPSNTRKAIDERHLRILRSKCLRQIRNAAINGLCFAAVTVPVFDFPVFKVAAPGASSTCTTCNVSTVAPKTRRVHSDLPDSVLGGGPPTAASGPAGATRGSSIISSVLKSDPPLTPIDYYYSSQSTGHAALTPSSRLINRLCAEWFRDTFNGPHTGIMAGAEAPGTDILEPLLVRHYWFEKPSAGPVLDIGQSTNTPGTYRSSDAAGGLPAVSTPGGSCSIPSTEEEECASAPTVTSVSAEAAITIETRRSSLGHASFSLGRPRTSLTAGLRERPFLQSRSWHIPGASEQTTLELLTMAPTLPALWQLAAQTLDRAPEEILSRYMLQLIQSLRFDDGGPLLSVLLRRSLLSRRLASQLYWGLQCETEDKVEGQRFLAAQGQLSAVLASSEALESGGLQTIELQRRLVRVLRWLSAKLGERRDRAERKTERLRSLLTSTDAVSFMSEPCVGTYTTAMDGSQTVTASPPASLLELPVPIPVPIRPTGGFLIGVIPERSFVVKSSQYPIVLSWRVLVPPPRSMDRGLVERAADEEVQPVMTTGQWRSSTKRRNPPRRPNGRAHHRLHLLGKQKQLTKDFHRTRLRANSEVGDVAPASTEAEPFHSLIGVSSSELRDKFGFEEVERRYLFKTGDDLRQDLMVSRLLQMLDALLLSYGCDFRLAIYDVVAFSRSDGLIEFIEDSESISSVKKTHPSLRHYFAAHAPDPGSPLGFSQSVLSSFIRSCSAYCVITFILGVGDRHLDNLLVCHDGRLFHVDYGFLFGDDPKPFPPPMKLCGEMIEALGSMGSQSYTEFQLRCCQCFRSLRRHSTLILDVLALMSRSGLRGFRTEASFLLSGVQQKFQLGLTEAQAEATLLDVVAASANAFLPAVVDKFHEWAVYWK